MLKIKINKMHDRKKFFYEISMNWLDKVLEIVTFIFVPK